MAEEEKKYTYSTRGRVTGGVINTLKTIGNVFGGRFHYYRTADLELAPRKKLKDAIDLLRGRIEELTHVETQYSFVEDRLRPQIEEIYKKLGFYTDDVLIDEERKLLSKGTGVRGKDEEIEIDGILQKFPIPDTKNITFPDGYTEEVSYFGYNQKVTWQNKYTKFIEKVCKDKIDKINNDNSLTPEQRGNMINVVNKVIKKSYLTVLPMLFAGVPGEGPEGIPENISAREKKMESFLYKLKEHHFRKLLSLRAELYKNMPDKVRYKHTYKVVDLNKIPNPDRWKDENGMPLEVATKGYKFEGRTYDKGDVLLDIFNHKAVIRNAKKYTKDLPLIDVMNYVHCEWDEYRDDLRDGRYHPDSLTVMDYILAANPSIGGEWKNKLKPLSIGPKYRKYKMKLCDGTVISHQREPTNLNPAFDLRAFKMEGGRYWQYVGKKKYYEHADNACTDEQHDPHISTRGLSMFIIETVCRQGKSLNEIHEELLDIGKETGGFDYGPRNFGAAFCKDPFNIDLSSATESVMKSPIIKGPPSGD